MKHDFGYDIIGDIHGHAAELQSLLQLLDYTPSSDGCYRHPTRRAVFLGDFIDRGPQIRQTLQIVRTMVDTGGALAVMGNHELNAIGYRTSDGAGGHLRPHTPINEAQHLATLEAFAGRELEWQDYLQWFGNLPLYLDLGTFRVVHACWDESAIAALDRSNRFDLRLLAPCGVQPTVRQKSLTTLLKGPEIPVPGGREFGESRREMRVKWWSNDRPLSYRNAALQVPLDLPDEPLSAVECKAVCGYSADAPPVFIGHYGYLKPAEPLSANVACVDLGVIRGGPLCAYRFDGEEILSAEKFVTTSL